MKAAEAWQVVTAPPLRTVALAALADLVPEAEAREPAAAVLLQARGNLEPGAWPEALRAVSDRPAPCDRPLLALVSGLGLQDLELLAVATALAAQLDPAAARAIAWLQGTWPEGQGAAALPTLGLLAAAGSPLGDHTDAALLQLLHGAAARAGLWVASQADLPSQRTIQLPALLLPWLNPGLPRPSHDTRLLAPSQQQVLHAALPQLRAGRALLVRSHDADDAQAAATWLAETMSCALLPVGAAEWPEGAALLARSGHALPVLQATGAPLVAPPQPLPVLVLAGPDGSVSLPGHRLMELRLPLPSVAERAAHWQHLAWPEPQALAQRCRCGLSQIQHLHEAAQLQVSARGQARATLQDLLQAQAVSAAAAFEGLGQLIDTHQPPQLVLNPANEQALQHLLARCRVREQLQDHAQQRPRPAVCALFSGPSGTGKTLAASWLAARLQLPMVAIDLAALTSKWIGETEKNLERAFAAARRANAVLFIDEADALLGKRSEVKDAHDRYANVEVAFLLQKMEDHDGVVIVATNLANNIDAAFSRRMQYVVTFPLPDAPARQRLWEAMLPPAAPRAGDLDIGFLARQFQLTGGEIRNVTLEAAFRAAMQGSAIGMREVLAAVISHYGKRGRLPHAGEFGQYAKLFEPARAAP
jgi:hypothetical protein